mmetsp:Transcript_12348/g.33965  ORF Transcript_12348/g.33965 Transcript_12348/m.33965 type:complete len:203 (-) Transcript_12348:130-738(-)
MYDCSLRTNDTSRRNVWNSRSSSLDCPTCTKSTEYFFAALQISHAADAHLWTSVLPSSSVLLLLLFSSVSADSTISASFMMTSRADSLSVESSSSVSSFTSFTTTPSSRSLSCMAARDCAASLSAFCALALFTNCAAYQTKSTAARNDPISAIAPATIFDVAYRVLPEGARVEVSYSLLWMWCLVCVLQSRRLFWDLQSGWG